MKFLGTVDNDTKTTLFDFAGDPDHHLNSGIF